MTVEGAEYVKATVHMDDLFDKYGLMPNRQGFIKCPFHSDDTASLKAYKGGTAWHCFGCNAGGSVIDFEMMMMNCSFPDAVEHLGGGHELSYMEKRRIANFKYQRHQKERIRKEKERIWWEAWEEWIRLDKNLMKYRPTNPDEELNPLFIEALQKLEYQNYVLDHLDETW